MRTAQDNVLSDNCREIFNWRGRSILQAAKKLLLTYGEGYLTIELIAKEANLGKGTVYNSFQSKYELYVCMLIEREMETLQLVEQLQSQVQREGANMAAILPALVKWKLKSPNTEYEFNKLETAVAKVKDKKPCRPELLSELKDLRTRCLHNMSQLLNSGLSNQAEHHDEQYDEQHDEETRQYHLFMFTVLMNGIAYALNADYTALYHIKENSLAELELFTQRLLHQVFSRRAVNERVNRLEPEPSYFS